MGKVKVRDIVSRFSTGLRKLRERFIPAKGPVVNLPPCQYSYKAFFAILA
jgi:hypothetical protein